jgi:hypothetical protein
VKARLEAARSSALIALESIMPNSHIYTFEGNCLY